jgi:hypothetical protein
LRELFAKKISTIPAKIIIDGLKESLKTVQTGTTLKYIPAGNSLVMNPHRAKIDSWVLRAVIDSHPPVLSPFQVGASRLFARKLLDCSPAVSRT